MTSQSPSLRIVDCIVRATPSFAVTSWAEISRDDPRTKSIRTVRNLGAHDIEELRGTATDTQRLRTRVEWLRAEAYHRSEVSVIGHEGRLGERHGDPILGNIPVPSLDGMPYSGRVRSKQRRAWR